jgi:hypothetical protein
MADSVPPADERVGDEKRHSEIASAILDRWPSLNHRQAAVLAAATYMPTIPGAAKAAGVGHVTVYGWLGRFPKHPEDAVPVFQEAWPICVRMGEENYVSRALALAESLNDKGNAAAPSVLSKVLSGFDQRFAGHTAAVSLDTQKVKRIILEREGEEKTP